MGNLIWDIRGMVYMSFALFLFRFKLFAFALFSCLFRSYDTSFWRLASLQIHVQFRIKSWSVNGFLYMPKYLAEIGTPYLLWRCPSRYMSVVGDVARLQTTVECGRRGHHDFERAGVRWKPR